MGAGDIGGSMSCNSRGAALIIVAIVSSHVASCETTTTLPSPSDGSRVIEDAVPVEETDAHAAVIARDGKSADGAVLLEVGAADTEVPPELGPTCSCPSHISLGIVLPAVVAVVDGITVVTDGACGACYVDDQRAIYVNKPMAATCRIQIEMPGRSPLVTVASFQVWGGCCSFGNVESSSPFVSLEPGEPRVVGEAMVRHLNEGSMCRME